MAGLKDADEFRQGERLEGTGFLGKVSLVAGAGAILLFFGLAFFFRHPGDEAYSLRDGMAYSWLFAIVFFLSLGVGGIFWTLLHHATNSGWGTVVRRLMENLGMMIPVVLVLALPLVFPQFGFRNALWEWFGEREKVEQKAGEYAEKQLEAYKSDLLRKASAAAEEVESLKGERDSLPGLTPGYARFFDDKISRLEKEASALAEHAAQTRDAFIKELSDKKFKNEAALLYVKKSYLEENFWLLRFFLYALVLAGGVIFLRALSLKQDQTGDPGLFTRMRGASCLLLLPFAVAWTFLMFDWLMTLDYSWFSTMWGVYLFAGAALNSMGTLILVLSWLRSKGYLKSVVTKEHYHIMGKLMHAFVIFWAYIAFSQFFLIWYANITEETKFFIMRNTGFWNLYSVSFLVIGHFFVPFFILLVRYCKTNTTIICAVAGWNLLMHVFDIYWIVIAERAPSLTKGEAYYLPGMWVFDVLAFIGVGGIFIYFLLRFLGSASLFPCRDPRLDESLNLTN